MLLRAGSGLAEAPLPDSAGLAPDVVQETLIAPLDDEAALEALFARHGARDRRGHHRAAAGQLRPAAAATRSSCRRSRAWRARTARC